MSSKKRKLHDGSPDAMPTAVSRGSEQEASRLRVLPRRTGVTQGRETSTPPADDVICIDDSSDDSDPDEYYQPPSALTRRVKKTSRQTTKLADLSGSFDVVDEIPSPTKGESPAAATNSPSITEDAESTTPQKDNAPSKPVTSRKSAARVKAASPRSGQKFLLQPSALRMARPSGAAASIAKPATGGSNTLLKKLLKQSIVAAPTSAASSDEGGGGSADTLSSPRIAAPSTTSSPAMESQPAQKSGDSSTKPRAPSAQGHPAGAPKDSTKAAATTTSSQSTPPTRLRRLPAREPLVGKPAALISPAGSSLFLTKRSVDGTPPPPPARKKATTPIPTTTQLIAPFSTQETSSSPRANAPKVAPLTDEAESPPTAPQPPTNSADSREQLAFAVARASSAAPMPSHRTVDDPSMPSDALSSEVPSNTTAASPSACVPVVSSGAYLINPKPAEQPQARLPSPADQQVAGHHPNERKTHRAEYVDCGVPFFRWPDQTVRRTPPSHWDFPLTSCRDLWAAWFFGIGCVGPLMHLTADDVAMCSRAGRARWVVAQKIIAAFVSAIESTTASLMVLPKAESLVRFDLAFVRVLLSRQVNPLLFGSKTFVQVGEVLAHAAKLGPSAPVQTNAASSAVPFARHAPQPVRVDSQPSIPPAPRRPNPTTTSHPQLATTGHVENGSAPRPVRVDSQPSVPPPTRRPNATTTTHSTLTNSTGPVENGYRMFMWADRMLHRVPQSWTFRDHPCQDVWSWWFRGDPLRRLCPLRELHNSDMPSERAWHDLARCRLVLCTMEAVMEANGVAVASLMRMPDEAFLQVFDSTLVNLLKLSRRASLDAVADRAGCLSFSRLYYFLITMEPPSEATSTWCRWFFRWSDALERRTPERAWSFPTASCRNLWWLWYHGDAAAGICPYRLFTDDDVPSNFFGLLTASRVIMAKMFDLAASFFPLSEDSMASLPPAVFETVVHKACELVLAHTPTLNHLATAVDVANESFWIVFRAVDDVMRQDLPAGLHRWRDGSVRRLPEGWSEIPLTNATCADMWKLWFDGDTNANLGPFRNLSKTDFVHPSTREWFEHLRHVMNLLTGLATGPLELAASPSAIASTSPAQRTRILSMVLRHATAIADPEQIPLRAVLSALRPDLATAPPARRPPPVPLSTCQLVMGFEDLPCRRMWVHWYFGNRAYDAVPYRHLTAEDMRRPEAVANWTAAAAVMAFVSAAVVRCKVVETMKDLIKLKTQKALRHVFDEVAPLVGVGPLEGFADMRCTAVHAILKTLRPNETDQAPDTPAPAVPDASPDPPPPSDLLGQEDLHWAPLEDHQPSASTTDASRELDRAEAHEP